MTEDAALPNEPAPPPMFADLVHRAMPGHDIVSESTPHPRLRRYNVIAVYRDQDHARNGVLALEGLDNDDEAVGLTVVEPHGVEVDEQGSDPDGVFQDLTPRLVIGGVIGAVLGAVVIGVATWLLAPDIWIGGALGGVLMGSAFGSIWGVFARMGGSSAYRQSFVATSSRSRTIVSMHTNDEHEADEARERLALQADEDPIVIRLDDGELSAEGT